MKKEKGMFRFATLRIKWLSLSVVVLLMLVLPFGGRPVQVQASPSPSARKPLKNPLVRGICTLTIQFKADF